MHLEFAACYPQGRRKGAYTVKFQVLIINWQIDFINFFVFNCLTLNINFFIFNCLASNFVFQKTYLSQIEENKKTKKVEENVCLWVCALSLGL